MAIRHTSKLQCLADRYTSRLQRLAELLQLSPLYVPYPHMGIKKSFENNRLSGQVDNKAEETASAEKSILSDLYNSFR